MPGIDEIWRRITALEGETFTQARGGQFTFEMRPGSLRPNRTNRNLPRSTFEEALRRIPLAGPGQIQDLQGPSYVFAILMDTRVRHGDW
jgi:hypothetical protein